MNNYGRGIANIEEVRRMTVSDARRMTDSPNVALTGIALIDIDRFHELNMALGREVCDGILTESARRIAAAMGHGELYRIGDDEFVAVLFGADHKEMEDRLETIRAAFAEPFDATETTLYVNVSIGGASPTDEDEHAAEHLLRKAGAALRHAKRLGKNRVCMYESKLPRFTTDRLVLEYELRTAIEQDQLMLYYQPRLELASEKVICLEALVRWNHPERGLILPNEFIPIAEESGLILELGDWVLRKACEQKRQWMESGIIPVQIAVNISPLQFRDAGFAARVLSILEETGMQPRSLELEITESSVMDDIDRTVEVLTTLYGHGCSISIDDFGIGYSSLSRLKHFPVKCLKIDRSFVRNMTSDRNDLAITHAIINLGHSLNLQVVAEGVEELGQLELLKEAACTTIQGYLLSPPRSAVELEQLFREEALVC